MAKAPIKFVCNACGSDDSIHGLAYVGWNTEKQDWEFEELWDDEYRCVCGENGNFREELITDLKTLARHAIRSNSHERTNSNISCA